MCWRIRARLCMSSCSDSDRPPIRTRRLVMPPPKTASRNPSAGNALITIRAYSGRRGALRDEYIITRTENHQSDRYMVPVPSSIRPFPCNGLFVKAQFSKSKNLLCIVEGLYPVKSSKFYDKTKDYCTYTTNNNNTKY